VRRLAIGREAVAGRRHRIVGIDRCGRRGLDPVPALTLKKSTPPSARVLASA
jgi:hypothetical protein